MTAPDTRDYFAELYVAGLFGDAGWTVYFPKPDVRFDFIATKLVDGEMLLRPVQVKGLYPTAGKKDKVTFGYIGELTASHPAMGKRCLDTLLRSAEHLTQPAGKSNSKRAPVSGSLRTRMVPRCASTMPLQMARPRPAPGRTSAFGPRQNRSNTYGRSFESMPRPLSCT